MVAGKEKKKLKSDFSSSLKFEAQLNGKVILFSFPCISDVTFQVDLVTFTDPCVI